MLTKKQIKQNQIEITELLQSTERPGIDKLIEWLEKDGFFTSPASTKFHGNFEGGLAAHSYKVYEEFWRQVQYYDMNVPRESAIVSGILHDACKVGLYIPNYLKSGKTSPTKPYKVEDRFPVGHGEKSVMLCQRYIDLTVREATLIRWHMGHCDPAWEDYREKVQKKFPEVILLQHADQEVSLLYQL